MIHIIYIYIIINAFFTGVLLEDNFKSYEPWKTIVVVIGGLAVMTPFLIVAFAYEYLKLCFDYSWFGNIYYVWRVKKGKIEVTAEMIELINKGVDKKKLKKRKSLSDRTYIWGAKHINAAYLKNF